MSDSSSGTFSFNIGAILGYLSTSCSSTYDVCLEAESLNTPVSVTVVAEYTLTVDAPGQVTVTLDGVPQGAGSFTMQLSPGWHTISVPDIVQLDSTSRLEFSGWSDGSTQLTRTFDSESDNEITANYVTQYRLTLLTSEGTATGDEWTDSGSTANFSVPATIPLNGTLGMLGGKYNFQGWYEGNTLITTHNDGSIVMNSPSTLAAKWSADYTQPAFIIGVIAIVALVGVLLFLRRERAMPKLNWPKLRTSKRSRKRTRRSKPRTDASTPEVEEPATVTPTTETTEVNTETAAAPPKTTTHCNQCGAVIARDSKFCKECGAKL